MRLFLLGLVAFGGVVANANDQVASVTRFAQLSFDANSVRVAQFRKLGNNQVAVTLTFKILPTDSCMENYAGLYQAKANAANFEVLYSHTGQPCLPQINPRIVPAKFVVTLGRGALPLTINGTSYGFAPNGDWTELKIQKISATGK